MAFQDHESILHTPTRSRRRSQFALLTLLGVITVVGIVLGRYFYYRPLTIIVGSRFAIIDGPAASGILSEHAPHSMAGTPYLWVILRDDELPEFLQFNGQSVTPIGNMAVHTIPHWPYTAFTGIYSEPKIVSLGPFNVRSVYESGQLSGFVGSRRAGVEPQFRVQCDMNCQHPTRDAMTIDHPDARIDLHGKLFYEGAIPDGHLVFLAPFGDGAYSVVIFDIKQ
jgi:hypothetical protein